MQQIKTKPFKCVCGNTILLFGNMVVCGSCGESFMIMVGKREDFEKAMKERQQQQKNPFE